MTTEKTIALTIRTFVGKLMSLLLYSPYKCGSTSDIFKMKSIIFLCTGSGRFSVLFVFSYLVTLFSSPEVKNTFNVKGQIMNIRDFLSHMDSVTTTKLCHFRAIDNT